MPDSLDNQPGEFTPPDDEAAHIASSDNGQEDLGALLDKLYERLPKIIARLRGDTTDPELLASIKLLFASFEKINALEKKILPQDQKGQRKDLSLSRIYELAEQGGGGADIEEVREANIAFAEENAALTQTVDSLTFEIKTLRRQAADEILGTGHAAPLERLDEALKGITTALSQIDAFVAQHAPSPAATGTGKRLDEQFLEGLTTLSPISPHLLEATPARTTFVGRALRRLGFAYDYKDIATVRQLVAASLKANRKLAELYQQTVPAGERVENLHHLLSMIELYAGHDERQGVQYKEAMEEIKRLQARIEAYDEKHGSLNGLSETIESRQTELSELEQNLHEIQTHIDEIMAPLNELKEENETLQKENQDLHKRHDRDQKEITGYKTQNEQLTQEVQKYREDTAALENMILAMKDGLLLRKLSAEIDALRIVAQGFENDLKQAREEKEALETRVETWVSDPNKLRNEISKWKKRATLNWGFGATACAVTGIGGAFLSRAIPEMSSPIIWYSSLVVGVPLVLCTVIGAVAEDHGKKLKAAVIGGGLGAVAGIVLGGIGIIPILVKLNNDKIYHKHFYQQQAYENQAHFLEKGQTSPFVMSRKDNGDIQIEFLDEKYKGKKVILDYSGEKPVMTIIENSPIEAHRPDNQPTKDNSPINSK